MLPSFVLRLSAAALASGRLAGEVEDVASGSRSQFRDGDELLAWCARTALPQQRPTVDLQALPGVTPPSTGSEP